MQLDAQTFLRLCEKAKAICFFDIEATGLNADYNSILTIAVKPFRQRARLFTVKKPGDDRKAVLAAKEYLESFACWVTYFGKGFDVKMIQGRLLVNHCAPLEKRHHVDLYFHMNEWVNTSRKSQAHRIDWLGVEEKKMSLSSDEWNVVLRNPQEGLKTMEKRCSRDAAGLEGLYRRTRHLIREVTR